MKILVISDIHANYTALDAVLRAADEVDAVWCLGDIVGYGPDPNECVERIRNLSNLICLLGNHDAAATGKIPLDAFNNEARMAAKWMMQSLTKDNLDFLITLGTQEVVHQVTLTHGSPRNPIWEYVLDIPIAKENFKHFETQTCLVGHTHIPLAFMFNGPKSNGQLQWKLLKPGEPHTVMGRTILNPGSVGQPRDRDPRAAYAIFYPEKNLWQSYRVEYDISLVQDRIREVNLPLRNALRLTDGW